MDDNQIYAGDQIQCTHCHRALVSGKAIMVEDGGQGRVFCNSDGRDCATRYMVGHAAVLSGMLLYGQFFRASSSAAGAP